MDWRVRSTLGAVLLFALGCGGDSGREGKASSATELLPLLPFTATVQQTDRIDLGTDLGDEHLIAGWSREPPDGVQPMPGSVAHIRSRQARLFFHLAEIGERSMEFRCAAVGGKRKGVSATFRLNGAYIGRHLFFREMSTMAMPLPPGAQVAGRNELTVVAGVSNPIPKPIAERYRLHESALACEVLRIVGAPPSVPVARLEDGPGGQRLSLQPGAVGEFYVLQEQDADLVVDASLSGPAGAGLGLTVERVGAGAETTMLYSGPVPSQSLRLRMNGFAGDVALVRVTATGKSGGRNGQRGDSAISGSVRIDRLAMEHEKLGPTKPEATPRAVNVILYVIDTLRADHLGCYGYPLPTSPNIDALAGESVLFEDALAQASWTRPAVGSLLTGLTPQRHGAVDVRSPLVSYVTTLPEILRQHGYATAAWVTNMNVSPRWGFERGFDRYEYLEEDMETRDIYTSASVVHEAASAWISEQGDRPFFLYLHATDVHSPYTPGPEWAQRFERRELRRPDVIMERPGWKLFGKPEDATSDDAAWLASLYDAEIAQFDAAFGAFLDSLRETDLLNRALLIFVSDHGEEFLEHGGFTHGRTLYDEQLHVPLLIRFPGNKQGSLRSTTLAQHIDVLPTILDYLGVPAAPDGIDGESLLPTLASAGGAGSSSPRVVLSHTGLYQRELVAASGSRWKVILDRGGQPAEHRRRHRPRAGPEVYDRTTDRRDRVNLGESRPEIIGYARQILAAGARGGREATPERQRINKKTLDRLRALGYVSQ